MAQAPNSPTWQKRKTRKKKLDQQNSSGNNYVTSRDLWRFLVIWVMVIQEGLNWQQLDLNMFHHSSKRLSQFWVTGGGDLHGVVNKATGVNWPGAPKIPSNISGLNNDPIPRTPHQSLRTEEASGSNVIKQSPVAFGSAPLHLHQDTSDHQCCRNMIRFFRHNLLSHHWWIKTAAASVHFPSNITK